MAFGGTTWGSAFNVNNSRGGFGGRSLADSFGGSNDDGANYRAGQNALGHLGAAQVNAGQQYHNTERDYESRMAQLAAQDRERNDRNNRFNLVYGDMRNFLGNFNAGFGTVGGQSGEGPRIDARPIWDDQQVNQKVNATRAQNDAAMTSQNNQLRQTLAGRGFGSNSPLLQSSIFGNQARNTAMNTDAERETRLGAAQANSGHVLKAQTAREGQFSNRQQEDIARRKTQLESYLGILGAMGGLV